MSQNQNANNQGCRILMEDRDFVGKSDLEYPKDPLLVTGHDYHYTGEQTGGRTGQISACVQAHPADVQVGYVERKIADGGVRSEPYQIPGLSEFSIERREVPKSKATSQNPKDLLGMKKPSLTKIPSFAVAHETMAMMDGASKYGAFNWRDKAVVAGIYIDACRRHLDLWFEGQEFAEDSGVHHLGHARACLGILLDALETGNLIDDRPVGDIGNAHNLEKVWSENMKRWQEAVEKRKNVQKVK